MAIVKNPKTGKYKIVKSTSSFYKSKPAASKPKPGQPIYIKLEDVGKAGGTGYSKPVGGEKIIIPNTRSTGGSSSSAAVNTAAAAEKREAERIQQELLKKDAKEKAEAEAAIAKAKSQAEKNRIARVYVDRQKQNENLQRAKINRVVSNQLRSSNLNPVKNSSGDVIAFKSDITGATYSYTDDGIAKYNKDVQTPGAIFRQMIKDRQQTGMSIGKTDDGKVRSLLNRYTDNVDRLQTSLAKSAASGEVTRLADLQRKRDLTARERAEKARLEKSVAANYRKATGMLGYTMAASVLGLGLGSVDLAKNLVKDPVGTSKKLPANVWAGLKQDFARAKGSSGGALNVAVEYITLAGVFKVLGKAKKSFKGAGKTMSPQFFNKLGKRLFIPPATLRNLAARTQFGVNIERSIAAAGKTSIPRAIKRGGVKVKKAKTIVEKEIQDVVKSGRKTKLKAAELARKNIKIIERKVKKSVDLSLKLAKKTLDSGYRKSKTVKIVGPNYNKAIEVIDNLAMATGEVKSLQYASSFMKAGGKLTKTQMQEFVTAARRLYLRNIKRQPEYRILEKLSKQDRAISFKLIKQGKIQSARKLLDKILTKLKSLKLTRQLEILLNKIKKGIRISKETIGKPIKKAKDITKSKIRKFKSNVQIAREKTLARKIAKRDKNKWRKVWQGDSRYIEVIVELENKLKARAADEVELAIKQLKKGGRKVGAGQKEELLRELIKLRMKKWKTTPEYKRLDELSKINKPYFIEIKKAKRFESSINLFKKNLSKIKKLPFPRKLVNTIKRTRKTLSIKRVRGKISDAKARKTAKREFRKTIKYRIEKARPERAVTLEQLSRTQTIAAMNNFIDRFFKELQKRQKITVSQQTYSQMKNILKKRMRRAIKRKDIVEIRNFGVAIKKLVKDINSKPKRPDIKISESVAGKKRIRTIKDFEPATPRGTFIEVRSGNQILLQEVKTVQKKAKLSKAKIIQVQKKGISLAPLVVFASRSLAKSAFMNMQKSRQGFTTLSSTMSISKALQKDRQDFAPLVKIGQLSKVSVTTLIAQDVNSRTRQKPRQKTKQITRPKEKKKIPAVTIPKKFKKKMISKAQPTYYVATRKRGKIVRLYAKPLTLKDARDYLAYSIDNNLTRTAWFVPMGKSKTVASPPKNIQGYYSKVSKKLRPYKIRQGKKKTLLNGYIEKTKYIQDTKREKGQLVRLRKKAVKRKMSSTQKKILVARLKKARAVRMRNLRRK